MRMAPFTMQVTPFVSTFKRGITYLSDSRAPVRVQLISRSARGSQCLTSPFLAGGHHELRCEFSLHNCKSAAYASDTYRQRTYESEEECIREVAKQCTTMQALHYSVERGSLKEEGSYDKGHRGSDLKRLEQEYKLKEQVEDQRSSYVKLIADEVFDGDASKVKVEHVYASELGKSSIILPSPSPTATLTRCYPRRGHISEVQRT